MAFTSENLIAAIFIRNVLWNQKNKNYHNRLIAEKSWEEISKELNEKVEVLKKKWKQLRDTYRNEIKKLPVERSGDAGPSGFDENKSSWPFFESMSFIKDQMKCRASSGNLKKIKIVDSDTTSCFQEEIDSFDVIDEESKRQLPTKYSPSRKRNINQNSEIINIEKRKLELLEQKSKFKNERCEDTAFFESLLPHVKKLGAEQKMLLRMEMQKLVYTHVYSTSASSPSTSKNFRPISTPLSSSNSECSVSVISPGRDYEKCSSDYHTMRQITDMPISLKNQTALTIPNYDVYIDSPPTSYTNMVNERNIDKTYLIDRRANQALQTSYSVDVNGRQSSQIKYVVDGSKKLQDL